MRRMVRQPKTLGGKLFLYGAIVTAVAVGAFVLFHAFLHEVLGVGRPAEGLIESVGVVLLVAGLLLPLHLFLQRRIARPLAGLVELHGAVARGEPKVRCDWESQDEIGRLASSFNRMVEMVRLASGHTAIAGELSIEAVLHKILESAKELVPARYAALAIPDGRGGFDHFLTLGITEDEKRDMGSPPSGRGLLGVIMREGKPIRVSDISKDPRSVGFPANHPPMSSFLGVPITSRGQVVARLYLTNRVGASEFSEEDERLLTHLGAHSAAAIENAHLYEELRHSLEEMKETYVGTLHALVAALDARDTEVHSHSQRVSLWATQLAEALGIPRDCDQWVAIQRGALLHDVGKIGVPDAILRKPGPLDPAEWVEMRKHPQIGYEMLKDVPFLQSGVEVVHAHHERYDGQGYPRGLAGEAIPLGARIFAVIDAYEAMTSDRPYRKALGVEQALEEVRRHSGSQFDPKVVEVFLRVVEKFQSPTSGPVGRPPVPEGAKASPR